MELKQLFENYLKNEELININSKLSEAELFNLLNYNIDTYTHTDKKQTFFEKYIISTKKEKIQFSEEIKNDLKKILLFVFVIVDNYNDTDLNEKIEETYPKIFRDSYDRIKTINEEAMKIYKKENYGKIKRRNK